MPEPSQSALRIIDANLNRAREALRVMEEYARFELNDEMLTSAIKRARHGLAECVPRELARALETSRDITRDVGRTIRPETEYQRADNQAVAIASAKRLTEALRAIEEYAKTIDRQFAVKAEELRYTAYELERRIAATFQARERFGTVRLYVLLTEALCRGEWLATAEAALGGGADCIQLREKELPDKELLARATQLAALCRKRGALLLINDRPDIALLSGAHGVHLGQDDLGIADARRVLRPSMLVGISTHTREQFEAAVEECPDYIAIGPVFSTPTKPGVAAVHTEMLTQACGCTSIPVVAIGGINIENVDAVLAAARCCVSVCGAVISARDPGTSTASLRKTIDNSMP